MSSGEHSEENWDWAAEDDEFAEEIGEDFQGEEDESCKSLFLPVVLPSAQEALAHDKRELGFDFNSIRSDLKLDFHHCVILINYIRQMVKENRAIIDGKQFECNEDVIAYMKKNDHFSKITMDLPFWKEEKYLLPTEEGDTMLFGFDWEEDDELDDEERERMLYEAKLEADAASGFIEDMRGKGINIEDLRE